MGKLNWIPKDPVQMVYCPAGPYTENWKWEAGYFYWIRVLPNEHKTYRATQENPGSKGVLCLMVLLPGDGGGISRLLVEPCPKELNGGVNWTWNQDWEKPTIRRSVDTTKGGKQSGWHGFITDGIMALNKPEGT